MPIYQFGCTSCGESFDHHSSIDDRNKPLENPCPNCHNEGTVTRELTAVRAVRPNLFKGLNSDHKFAMKQLKKRHNNGKNNIPDY